MSLIQSEQDDPEVLRAEDEAIRAAADTTPKPRTALDDLVEMLSERETPVHETPEG